MLDFHIVKFKLAGLGTCKNAIEIAFSSGFCHTFQEEAIFEELKSEKSGGSSLNNDGEIQRWISK